MEGTGVTFIFEKTEKLKNDANCHIETNDNSKVFRLIKNPFLLSLLISMVSMCEVGWAIPESQYMPN